MRQGCYKDITGQGVDVFTKDDRILVYWYTFDRNGDRRWFWATGVADNLLTLFTTTDGTFDNPRKCKVVRAGTAQFKDDVFLYNSEQHGRGAIEPKPIVYSTDTRSGAYYQPDQAGSGLSIQYLPNDRASAYWFTYHDGKQKWFTCQGHTYGMKMYEWVGGTFRYPAGELIEVGGASLDGMKFTYELDAVGIKAQGELNLTKLF